jgi:hypothetical protein
MKTVLVGVEQAGGKLAERVVEYDLYSGYELVQNTIVINSFSEADKERWVSRV